MVQGDIRFGRNLNILRSRNNMSQQELADKIHVTRQTISIWERGEGKPDIYFVKDICRIFGVSMDELVCGNVMLPDHKQTCPLSQMLPLSRRVLSKRRRPFIRRVSVLPLLHS